MGWYIKLLKEIVQFICKLLKFIINKSLKALKKAIIRPICKMDNKKKIENCRPIVFLPILPKVDFFHITQ